MLALTILKAKLSVFSNWLQNSILINAKSENSGSSTARLLIEAGISTWWKHFGHRPNVLRSPAGWLPRVGFEPTACRLTGEGCFQHVARREDKGLQDRRSRLRAWNRCSVDGVQLASKNQGFGAVLGGLRTVRAIESSRLMVCSSTHNPKVVSSNLTPATISKTCLSTGLRDE
jgi:hypothetical protein